MDCIFCKIVAKEMPTEIVYEDNDVLAFNDIDPKAPHHLLIIPKRHITTMNDLATDDEQLVGHINLVAVKLAKQLGIEEQGYRVLMNCNSGGGQAVYHIHLHLLGGRQMNWPPG